MIKIYSAANLPDAYLLAGLLGSEGIKARVLNANAHGGLGEIPVACTYPEIWIENPRDVERTRKIIERFEGPASSSASLVCRQCGEDNPTGFELCWNCLLPLESE
jgi:hypothetical protein